jgi:hypothetical protein
MLDKLKPIHQEVYFALYRFCEEIDQLDQVDYLYNKVLNTYEVDSPDPYDYDDLPFYIDVLRYWKDNLIPHKIAVYKAGFELLEGKAFKWLCGLRRGEFIHNLLIHDLSKFSAVESIGYLCFVDSTIYKKDENFKYAWLHHKNNNPHHPEYWINNKRVNNRNRKEVLKMPNIYLLEMMADIKGASIYGESFENYVINNWHRFQLHEDSMNVFKMIFKQDLGIDLDEDKDV